VIKQETERPLLAAPNDAINTINGDIVQVNDEHGKKANYSNLASNVANVG
jgi:hypothetical protein